MSAGTGEAASGHLRGLDALRGLAALVVVFRHTLNAVEMPMGVRRALVEGPLAPLLNAQGAVQLFFVLSGYVLALSLARGRGRLGWIQFWVKRVLRIHPPYVFGVLVAFGASAFYLPVEAGTGLTRWFARWTGMRVEAGDVLASLTFPGMAHGLLPVGWTLEIEMIYSLALPLLIVAARPGRGVPLLLACAGALLLDRELLYLWFALDFALGVVAFKEREALGRRLRALPAAGRVGIAAAGVLLFAAPQLLGWSVPSRGILVSGLDAREIAVMGVGSAVLVACAAWLPGWQRALSHPALVFLGRISFSLYLLHLTWIHLLAPRLVSPHAPGSGFLLLAAVLAATIATSVLSHRFVELPSIALGNRACRWLVGRFGGRAAPSHAAAS